LRRFWNIDCPIEREDRRKQMKNNLMPRISTIGCAALFVFCASAPAHANPVSRRATITGGGGNGRCTVEVNVDASAEVEVAGDTGLLTTISGQPADWRRFQCNAPLPHKPADFRFIKIGGRGNMRLIQDPRSTGGRAVVHIDDPKGGRGIYTFDLQWQGPGGGGWTPGPQFPPPGHGPGPGPGPGPGGFPTARAIRVCQDSVTSRLNRDGYRDVNFQRTFPVDNPGRHDRIQGTVSGKRGFGATWFSFSCSVDFSSGRVRSVDVWRR
jgi:hypothetical protein